MLVHAHLLGEEVVQSRLPKDLGELNGKSKRVGQPGLATVLAKLGLEVSLSVEILPHKTLGRRNHAIMLEPGASNWEEAFLVDNQVFHLGKGAWVELFQPEKLLGRRRRETEMGVSLDQVALRRPTPGNLLLSLRVAPQPCGINVTAGLSASPQPGVSL